MAIRKKVFSRHLISHTGRPFCQSTDQVKLSKTANWFINKVVYEYYDLKHKQITSKQKYLKN